jgi:hypothetical protein
MITDSRTIPDNTELKCDLCIVGAGAAGITLALQFVQSKHSVIVLESGGEKLNTQQQKLNHGDVLDGVHPPISLYRPRRLGGSTVSWGGRCVPLDEQDFRKRPHVPLSGWPIDLCALLPYYERAQRLLEAGVFDYSSVTALPRCDELIEGFRDPDILTQSLERFSPPTNFWKRYRAKLAESATVTVIKHATCLRLSGHRAVTVLECASAGDVRFKVRPRLVVLAVGGLEVVRVLAHSGYGNHSGNLGRTYMSHIEAELGRLRLSPPNRGIQFGFERTRDGVYCRRRFTLRAEKQNALGILNAAIRLHHPNVVDPSHRHSVLSAIYLIKKIILPEERFAVVEREVMRRSRNDARFRFAHVRNVVFDAPRLVSFGLDWIFRRHFSHWRIPSVALANAAGVYPLDFNGEQAPNPESRVWLGHETDHHGVPKLRVDWRVSELDWLTLSRMLRELKRAVEARCSGTIEYNVERLDQDARSSVVPLAGHHIGTARMSENPATGVVTADCRVHYVDTLYVGGSATFPTCGQANPMLTIVAMALRLAQHLEMRLAD